jgi:hypothetical protein
MTLPPYPHSYHGVAAAVEGMRTDDGGDSIGSGDHFSHAAGRICQNCDRRIEAREPARRKGENGWVHDVCPPARD